METRIHRRGILTWSSYLKLSLVFSVLSLTMHRTCVFYSQSLGLLGLQFLLFKHHLPKKQNIFLGTCQENSE